MKQEIMWFGDGSGIGHTICKQSASQSEQKPRQQLNFCTKQDAFPDTQPTSVKALEASSTTM